MKTLISSILFITLNLFVFSQETYTDSLIYYKYGYHSFQTKYNESQYTSITFLDWIKSKNSIVFNIDDKSVDNVTAEFLFKGRNNIQLNYILSEEITKEAVVENLANEILFGKWVITDNDIYITLINEGKELKFQMIIEEKEAYLINLNK